MCIRDSYGDGSDLPLWNGLARSLNTIAVRVGDLVGASNIFNFVYDTPVSYTHLDRQLAHKKHSLPR